MEQDNPIMQKDDSLQELVSLQREQLGVLQQINVKSGAGGGGGPALSPSFITAGGISPSAFAGDVVQSPMVSGAVNRTAMAFESLSQKITQGQINPGSMQTRLADASQNFTNALTGGMHKLGSVAGIAGSLVGMPVVGAAVGMVVDAAANSIETQQQYSNYLYRYSNQAINAFESDNAYGNGGFSYRDSQRVGEEIYRMAPRYKMSHEQLQNVTMIANESGLLRNATDSGSYTKMLEEIVKQTKSIATATNTSVTQATQMLAALNRVGITAQSGRAETLTSMANIASTLLPGTDAKTIVDAVVSSVQQMTNGTGYNQANMTTAGMSNTMYTSRLYDDLRTMSGSRSGNQDILYNYINNMGAENAGMMLTQGITSINSSSMMQNTLAAMSHYDEETGEWVTTGSIKDLKGKSQAEIAAMAQKNLAEGAAANPGETAYFLSTSGERLSNMNSYAQLALIQNQVESLKEMTGGRVDTKTLLMQNFGMDANQAALVANQVDQDLGVMLSQQGMSMYQAQVNENWAQYGSLGQTIKSGFQTLGQNLLSPFRAIGSAVSSFGNDINQAYMELVAGPKLSNSSFLTETAYWQSSEESRAEMEESWSEEVADYNKKAKEIYEQSSSSTKRMMQKLGLTPEYYEKQLQQWQSMNDFEKAEVSLDAYFGEMSWADQNAAEVFSGLGVDVTNINSTEAGHIADLIEKWRQGRIDGLNDGSGYTAKERSIARQLYHNPNISNDEVDNMLMLMKSNPTNMLQTWQRDIAKAQVTTTAMFAGYTDKYSTARDNVLTAVGTIAGLIVGGPVGAIGFGVAANMLSKASQNVINSRATYEQALDEATRRFSSVTTNAEGYFEVTNQAKLEDQMVGGLERTFPISSALMNMGSDLRNAYNNNGTFWDYAGAIGGGILDAGQNLLSTLTFGLVKSSSQTAVSGGEAMADYLNRFRDFTITYNDELMSMTDAFALIDKEAAKEGLSAREAAQRKITIASKFITTPESVAATSRNADDVMKSYATEDPIAYDSNRSIKTIKDLLTTYLPILSGGKDEATLTDVNGKLMYTNMAQQIASENMNEQWRNNYADNATTTAT